MVLVLILQSAAQLKENVISDIGIVDTMPTIRLTEEDHAVKGILATDCANFLKRNAARSGDGVEQQKIIVLLGRMRKKLMVEADIFEPTMSLDLEENEDGCWNYYFVTESNCSSPCVLLVLFHGNGRVSLF